MRKNEVVLGVKHDSKLIILIVHFPWLGLEELQKLQKCSNSLIFTRKLNEFGALVSSELSAASPGLVLEA